VLRKNEFEKVQQNLRDKLGLKAGCGGCEQAFPAEAAGRHRSGGKRKIIGNEFIAVFDDEANRIAEETGGVEWLVQGTLYPDV